MIIETVCEVVVGLFMKLTFFLDLPQIPDAAMEYIDLLAEYITLGLGFISNYTHLSYLLSLFGIIVTIDLGIGLYKLVMWIIRKFPIASE